MDYLFLSLSRRGKNTYHLRDMKFMHLYLNSEFPTFNSNSSPPKDEASFFFQSKQKLVEAIERATGLSQFLVLLRSEMSEVTNGRSAV